MNTDNRMKLTLSEDQYGHKSFWLVLHTDDPILYRRAVNVCKSQGHALGALEECPSEYHREVGYRSFNLWANFSLGISMNFVLWYMVGQEVDNH